MLKKFLPPLQISQGWCFSSNTCYIGLRNFRQQFWLKSIFRGQFSSVKNYSLWQVQIYRLSILGRSFSRDDSSVTRESYAKFSKVSYTSSHVAKQVTKQEEKDLTSPKENDRNKISDDSAVLSRKTELQCHIARLPSLRKCKSPFLNSSVLNADAAGSVLAQKKKLQVKEISEVECCSDPSSLSDLGVGYDDLEWDLRSYGMIKKKLRDLNFLPDGYLPLKQTTIYLYTTEILELLLEDSMPLMGPGSVQSKRLLLF